MMNVTSIPFHAEAHDGFAETKGFIKILGDRLKIDYQTKDAILGVMKTGVKSIEIKFSDIGNVTYKSNIFRTVMVITVTSFESAAALGNGSEDVKFYIKRKNRKMTLDFIDNLKLFIAEYNLKQLEKGDESGPELLNS